MMTKIDNLRIYTEEEANEVFYPNSYVMTESVYNGNTLSGIVVAYSALDEKSGLLDYATDLSRSGKFGWVTMHDTKDPLDGGTLLYELYQDE